MCQGEKALRRSRVSAGGQIPVLQSVADGSSGVEAAKGVLECFVAKHVQFHCESTSVLTFSFWYKSIGCKPFC